MNTMYDKINLIFIVFFNFGGLSFRIKANKIIFLIVYYRK